MAKFNMSYNKEVEISDVLLENMCKHCNNYFNPHNDPSVPRREYPTGFLEIAWQIMNVYTIDRPVETDADFIPWKKAFAPQLANYKRAKFI